MSICDFLSTRSWTVPSGHQSIATSVLCMAWHTERPCSFDAAPFFFGISLRRGAGGFHSFVFRAMQFAFEFAPAPGAIPRACSATRVIRISHSDQPRQSQRGESDQEGLHQHNRGAAPSQAHRYLPLNVSMDGCKYRSQGRGFFTRLRILRCSTRRRGQFDVNHTFVSLLRAL